jgi:RNA polymerase-associated protein RTF1
MNHITLPTLEELETKIKDIKAALAYQFKEEDVEKVYKIPQAFLNIK